MATDAEEIPPKETEVEEKANSVCSLNEGHKYPLTVTDRGNFGFFLEQTDASLWGSLTGFLTAVWSMIFSPYFYSLFPFAIFRLAASPIWLCGIAWCTVSYCFEPWLEHLMKSPVLQGRERDAFSGMGRQIGWGSVKLPFLLLQHAGSSSQPQWLVTCTWCSLVTFSGHSENHKIHGLIRVE